MVGCDLEPMITDTITKGFALPLDYTILRIYRQPTNSLRLPADHCTYWGKRQCVTVFCGCN